MLNRIILMGRLTKNPTIRKAGDQSNYVCFSIAVDRDVPNRNGERITDFFDCVAWRQLANHIFNYYKKGDSIIVEGRMMQRKYIDENKIERTIYEVQVDNANFPERKIKT